MSVMKDTVNLRPFVADVVPTIPNNDAHYWRQEFVRIQNSIAALIKAAQALEARLVAGGL